MFALSPHLSLSENLEQHYLILSIFSRWCYPKGLGTDCTSNFQVAPSLSRRVTRLEFSTVNFTSALLPVLQIFFGGYWRILPLDTKVQEGQGEGKCHGTHPCQQPSELCAYNPNPSSLNPSTSAWYEWSQRALMTFKPEPRNLQLPQSWASLKISPPRFGPPPKFCENLVVLKPS